MSDARLVYLCPSFNPYWVQIFDSLNDRLGPNFTVITQSFHSAENARIAQGMGRFQRKIVTGGRISLADRESEGGHGTPFGLNIAPSLPFTLFKLRPQVVITNNFGLWTLAAIGMGYTTVIFWEGTLHTERTVKKWRHRIRQWIVRRAGAFVVNGTAAREYLREGLGVDDASIFVGGLCSDKPPIEFQNLERPRKNVGDQINFLFVGRLIKGKGADRLFRAAALLKRTARRSENFAITVVGGGPERLALTKLANELGIGKHIRFIGEIHPNAIWRHYAEADVFVLPTLHDNWPLVVLEAMSMGLPILLSVHAGSLPDLVFDSRNGYGFDPSDEQGLADLMQNYIKRPNLLEAQGLESKKLSMSFTPDHAVDAFMRACKKTGGIQAKKGQ